MLLVRAIILLFVSTVIGGTLSVTCTKPQSELKISDLPQGIITDIRSILTGGLIELVGGCQAVKETDVLYYLYTRERLQGPLVINAKTVTLIDASKPVIFITHGWISSAFGEGVQILKDAYLADSDCNVIVVDWSNVAQNQYIEAFCKLPDVSDKVGDFLCLISKKLEIKLKDIHMVGHSMGAHLSGLSSQRAQLRCRQKLGRITGLDPAGPLFQKLPKDKRLDLTDADFVDVIHSNSGQFGYVGACGNVDFYVNCGTFQPQCPAMLLEAPWSNFMKLAVSVVGCSHGLSWYYMAESIKEPEKYKAVSCTLCIAVVCVRNILFPKYTIMGEHTPIKVDDGTISKTYIVLILKSSLYEKQKLT